MEKLKQEDGNKYFVTRKKEFAPLPPFSKQIIDAHGGKIWLESKINKGSEFSFLLPDVVQNLVEVIND